MRMLCRHVVLNFRPRRPLSTFNITSSSTLVTTGTLRASHVSTKAVAGEAAGVAGQALASIQWFLSWFHIKKTRRLQQLVRQIGFKTRGVWFLKALCTCDQLIVWQVLKLLQETKPFSNTCVRDQSFLQLAIDTVYNYQERTRTELVGWSWLIVTTIGLTHASTDFFHVMFAFTEFLPFSLKLFKSCLQVAVKPHQGTRGINDPWNFAVLH